MSAPVIPIKSEERATRICQVVAPECPEGLASSLFYYRNIDRALFQFDFVALGDVPALPQDEVEALGGRVFYLPGLGHLRDCRAACCELFRKHWEWETVHAHMDELSDVPLAQASKAGIHMCMAHAYGDGSRTPDARMQRRVTKRATVHLAASEGAGLWLYGQGQRFEVVPDASRLGDDELADAVLHLERMYAFLSHWVEKYNEQ